MGKALRINYNISAATDDPFYATFHLVLISLCAFFPSSSSMLFRLHAPAKRSPLSPATAFSAFLLFELTRIVCSLAVRFDDPLKVPRYLLNNFKTCLKKKNIRRERVRRFFSTTIRFFASLLLPLLECRTRTNLTRIILPKANRTILL